MAKEPVAVLEVLISDPMFKQISRLFGCATQVTTDVNPISISGNPTPQLGNVPCYESSTQALGRFNCYFLIILVYNVVYHATSTMGYVEIVRMIHYLDIHCNMLNIFNANSNLYNFTFVY
jgi:hypothetical protein